ncbi:MAG TPA: YdcF family protein [Chitinophagaceae bacterium]
MFLLGKLFLLLLRPLTWIVIIFLIGIVSKNPARKKRLVLAAFILLLFFSNPFFFRLLAKGYEKKAVILAQNERYQAGILLGGFVSYNIKKDKAYFSEASDRFIETALLYKTGHISKVIVSAGNGYVVKHNFQEASFAKDRLVELGITAQDIFTDGLSRNTYQNAVNTKQICDSLHLTGPFLLISSAMHLPRAEALFARQKLNVRSYPCDFITENIANNFWEDYLVPSSNTLYYWDNFIKEVSGLLIYKIIGRA